ncbi:cyanophycinase [Microbacterium sp. AG1240]|uniref:Type 1 glutamine amidotransferase-like domain-containing protein n=1 Tax=Microbacterium sp. AG1240 TaxID=2183992 RepID=UPI000EAF81E0|nr:Type 1 glutamine amidotransferase-like domain-containing protein [Microbacterium sp. AG1240]RKT31238.1 cyanophycinase [Microbacterium sp. AG1240]
MGDSGTRRTGSIHLIGGGRDAGRLAPLFAAFVEDAAQRRADAAARPRIHLLIVREPGDEETAERFAAPLRSAGADVVIRAVDEGEAFAADALNGADGIAVGGGLTPAYRDACGALAASIRSLVARGAPYLGFSAGSAIAAGRALLGGYRLDGVEVGDEGASEELDELEVADGLGLVPFAIDVHAAQWGTLSRLVAAVDAGLVPEGYAIDEHTVVVVRDGVIDVVGAGAAWHVSPGVTVRRVRPRSAR